MGRWGTARSGRAGTRREAVEGVAAMDASAAPVAVRAADLRYRGQSFELTVPMRDDPEGLAEAFHAAHDRAFGHAEPGAPVQVVSLRVTAALPAPAVRF